MLKKILEYFKNLDKMTKIIIKHGLSFCSSITIISLIILVTYNLSITTPLLYLVGLSLFRISLIFAIEFIICGFAVDKIKKDI